MRPTEADIVAAKSQSPNVEMIEAAELDIAVLVKRPTRQQYRLFRESISDEARRAHAPENLLLGCLVWPDRKTFESKLDELPALSDTLSGDLLKIAGLSKSTEKKSV